MTTKRHQDGEAAEADCTGEDEGPDDDEGDDDRDDGIRTK